MNPIPTVPLVLLVLACCIWKTLCREQIRQCTCEEQHQCFERMKEEVEQCALECLDRTDLNSMTHNPSGLVQCFGLQKRSVQNLLDCLNGQFGQQLSCANKAKMVAFNNFEGKFLHQMHSMIEKVRQHVNEFGARVGGSAPALLRLGNCGSRCVFRKLLNLQCFYAKKCDLLTSEVLTRQTIDQCFAGIDFRAKVRELCSCFSANGVNDFAQFCAAATLSQK